MFGMQKFVTITTFPIADAEIVKICAAEYNVHINILDDERGDGQFEVELTGYEPDLTAMIDGVMNMVEREAHEMNMLDNER